MSTERPPYTGHCLCGAIQYRIDGDLHDAHLCHCGMCQRQSGNAVAGVGAKRAEFSLTGEDTLVWYQSSSFARRGFCSACGSNLFWDDGSERLGINMGSLDKPTGLSLEGHIFVEDKPDWYEITDGLPQFEGPDKPVSTG